MPIGSGWSRRWARPAAAALAVVAVGGLTACDPAIVDPPDPGAANVTISVATDGRGAVDVVLGHVPGGETRTALRAAVRDALFGDRVTAVDLEVTGLTAATLSITADDVFVPGAAPTVDIDTLPICTALRDAGFEIVHLSLSAPGVRNALDLEPPAIEDDGTIVAWPALIRCVDAPSGVIRIRPDPTAWWTAVGALALVVVLVGAAMTLGWRRMSRGSSMAVFLTACFVGWGFAGARLMSGSNDLVALGRMSPDAAHVVAVMGAIIVAAAIAAATVHASIGTRSEPARPLAWPPPSEPPVFPAASHAGGCGGDGVTQQHEA